MDVTFGEDSCYADFGWVNTSVYSYTLNPSYTGGSSYFWSFSDGPTNYMTMNPSPTFSAPGSYVVCLTMYDSLGGLCDSLCHSITVGTTGLFGQVGSDMFKIYSTVSAGHVTLDGTSCIAGSDVELLDIQCQVIGTWFVPVQTSTQVQLGEVSSGVYLLRIRSGVRSQYQRLLIQH